MFIFLCTCVNPFLPENKVDEDETNLSENESDFNDLESENDASQDEPEIVESQDSPISC